MATSVQTPYVMKAADQGTVLSVVKFDTNNTSTPDGVVPTTGVTVARSDVGIFTITYADDPGTFLGGWGVAAGANPGIHVKIVSYSSQVLTVHQHDEDNTSGVQALADSTDIALYVFALFTNTTGDNEKIKLSDVA